MHELFLSEWYLHSSSRKDFLLTIHFCRYKIYAEGYAWSVSMKYILSCGSLSLIISPQYEDFFSRGLIPGKNFWPISSADLCPSLKYAVDWGNAHPAEVWSLLFISLHVIYIQLTSTSTRVIIIHWCWFLPGHFLNVFRLLSVLAR